MSKLVNHSYNILFPVFTDMLDDNPNDVFKHVYHNRCCRNLPEIIMFMLTSSKSNFIQPNLVL